MTEESLTFVDNETGEEYELPSSATDKEIMAIASKAAYKPKCPYPSRDLDTCDTMISSTSKEVRLGMRLYPFIIVKGDTMEYYDYIQIGDVLLYAPDDNQIVMAKYKDLFAGLTKKDVKRLSIYRY